ncbi:LuxR family transcriptional regulator [Acerihabitans sp. TG2]|uniref:LuxR family transcriptional regulator n=1 Tax=Acerihabitans sp. TG2 TaxID=3096008 RepID=UPI002B237BF2|nr:LuxR family transcriptional regulator [Acerihabitans sp. TG2]MEA9390494.1 LuxR family transcriptional regulator [Acerihabitans sp. TG2]
MYSLPSLLIPKEETLSSGDVVNCILRELSLPEHTHFAYSVINKKDAKIPIIHSNYPAEWVERYINTALYKYDPVLAIASRKITPFRWGDSQPCHHLGIVKNIFDISKKYNIISGYTFPLHDHKDNLATLSFYKEDNQTLLDECLEKNNKNIQSLLIYIHNSYFFTSSHSFMVAEHSVKKTLTARELEALHWASKGKTYGEIAMIMGITESTVKFHIGNVVTKLDVVNAKHAIKKASDLQLFVCD